METTIEMQQLASEISSRIANLESLFEQPLKDEMEALKKALVENPNAAALLKDEDVGLLVNNLRRTVTAAKVNAEEEKKSGRKSTSNKKKQLTEEELEAALAAEGF